MIDWDKFEKEAREDMERVERDPEKALEVLAKNDPSTFALAAKIYGLFLPWLEDPDDAYPVAIATMIKEHMKKHETPNLQG